jgi:hypothetical protein
MNIIAILLVLAAIAVLAWNFIPSLREALRGWTTVLEGILATSLVAADVAVQAFQSESTFWSSVIPEGSWAYVSIGLAIWMIFKRVVTSSAIGDK